MSLFVCDSRPKVAAPNYSISPIWSTTVNSRHLISIAEYFFVWVNVSLVSFIVVCALSFLDSSRLTFFFPLNKYVQEHRSFVEGLRNGKKPLYCESKLTGV